MYTCCTVSHVLVWRDSRSQTEGKADKGLGCCGLKEVPRTRVGQQTHPIRPSMGPRPGQPTHLLLAHVLWSQPINNRSAFAFAFLPFLFGRLGLKNTWLG